MNPCRARARPWSMASAVNVSRRSVTVPARCPCLARASGTDRGCQHRAQPPRYLRADRISQERISTQRQVTAVILHRPKRHHHCRDAGIDQLLQLARGQPLQLMHTLAHG